MAQAHRRLSKDAFEKLREQLATASVLCSDEQLLDLADDLHDSLRRRKDRRHGWGFREELATF